MSTWPVLAAGACVGLGLALLVRALLPQVPDLTAALDRLDPTRPAPAPPAALGPVWAHRATGRVLPGLAHALGLARFTADLRRRRDEHPRVWPPGRSATPCSGRRSRPCSR